MDLDLARALIAALPPGPDIAHAMPPIDPFDRSRGRYAKVLCRRATGQPAINRRYKPITKVIGKGSCHAGWPPSPAHTLNQKFELVGIPYDSIRSEIALDALPKYEDLFMLMDVARDAVEGAKLAIDGQSMGLKDSEKYYREEADDFWRTAFQFEPSP